MSDFARFKSNSENPYVLSVIAEGASFRGDLEIRGIIHINGDFFGDVKVDGDIAIGATGRAKCSVQANNVVINGIFQGEIKAHNSVKLHAPAVIFGNIEANTILIEDGVIFNGNMQIYNVSSDKKSEKSNQLADDENSADGDREKGYSVWQQE